MGTIWRCSSCVAAQLPSVCRLRTHTAPSLLFLCPFWKIYRFYTLIRAISIFLLLCRFLLRAAAAFWRQSEGKRFRDPRLLFISVQHTYFCEKILSFSEKPHCVCALRAMLYKKEGVEMVFLPIASPFQSRYNIRKRNIFSF
ncbi:hypothetical protein [uncultured Gemmiger sp.]|uniref:hypothetical protein n=1 Tax=uncultured Gemmiger sp. TaxID=1623490 RepID=UPI0025DE875C|nr:hypothetical protein [uncultured Gemmiger sp.]